MLLGLVEGWCLELLGGLQSWLGRLEQRGRIVIHKKRGGHNTPEVSNGWMAWIKLGLKAGHRDVVRLLSPEKEWIEHHW